MEEIKEKEVLDEQKQSASNCEKKKKKDKNNHKEEIEKLQLQNKDLEERLLREKAESINYRRRKEDEVSKIMKYASEDIIINLLPTLDNFERAINMDDDNLEDEVSKFLSGFKMIYSNLRNILEKEEVKAIDGNNKPFDPCYHQAMLTEKRDDLEPGMVIEVLQKGYIYKDKVIRPAMVKVSE
ncbi:MAG: nucleotide exchange factor GrpE [Bacilli bacterium]|nr:nucleotide exchange factor GrpE [Bacilli bacterium]